MLVQSGKAARKGNTPLTPPPEHDNGDRSAPHSEARLLPFNHRNCCMLMLVEGEEIRDGRGDERGQQKPCDRRTAAHETANVRGRDRIAVADGGHRDERQPHGVPDKKIIRLFEFVAVDNPGLCLRKKAVGMLRIGEEASRDLGIAVKVSVVGGIPPAHREHTGTEKDVRPTGNQGTWRQVKLSRAWGGQDLSLVLTLRLNRM